MRRIELLVKIGKHNWHKVQLDMVNVLTILGYSKAEAKRLIDQKGVEVYIKEGDYEVKEVN